MSLVTIYCIESLKKIDSKKNDEEWMKTITLDTSSISATIGSWTLYDAAINLYACIRCEEEGGHPAKDVEKACGKEVEDFKKALTRFTSHPTFQ